MTNRFLGIAIFWLLVLTTAFVAEPYVVAWWFSASSPRTITPAASLTETERTTIKLFQTVSPSVVSVFARVKPQTLLTPGQEEGGDVQTGSGIIWDAAGHVITNYHVIKGTNQFAAHLPSGESVAGPDHRHRAELRHCGAAIGKDSNAAASDRHREFRRSASWPIRLCHRQSLWIGADFDRGDHQRAAPDHADGGGS